MKSFTRFTRRTTDLQIEAEFRAAYQAAGVPYLFLASLLATVGFSAFYLLDILYGRAPALGDVQTVRVVVVIAFGLLAFALKTRPAAATHHYSLIANAALLSGILLAVWVAVQVHGEGPSVELLWNMNTSILTPILVIYGASRLTLLNTTAIVIAGVAVSVAMLVVYRAPPVGVIRVVVDILLVSAIAITFRIRGENREWDLFVLAKENYNNSEGNKTKMRFLANMSHEVRTPLSGLLQIMDLVKPSAPGADQKLISAAKASGAALLKVLNGILDYSALSTPGATRVLKAPTDLAEVCRTVLSLHTAALSVKDLELRVRLDLGPSDLRVLTDNVMLFEILTNLVSNAIKFTETGFLELTAVLVSARVSDRGNSSFLVHVSDSGIGISNEDLPKIYSPFYQVDTSTSRRVGGTGLGLSIVKGLVEALGGAIDISSQVAVGTTIRVEIPVDIISMEGKVARSIPWEHSYPHDIAEDDPSPANGSHYRLNGRILLIDDNDVNVMLYSDYLSKQGFEVVAATDGKEGVEQAKQGRFDIILMDCLMPVMDGFTATREIRKFERTAGLKKTPIIAFTANAVAGEKQRCLDAGMNDHFAKGQENSELRALLLKWLPAEQNEMTK